ncbi:unnamed protein product [Rotaria magnacalcarata]|uniref:Uncharacterized protein n=1 Tax=Rotaria magnacalcarata TaxID=392030 RepID=A0A816SH48_9BILA|nr:unnamed protein product [Rotaria magnacalcarata]
MCSAYINANSIWKKNAITVAGGNGPGGGINQIHDPHALFLDNDQTIYIADINNDRIVEWKSGAGCGRIIAGGNGQLHHPNDVIVDKARNSVFICEPLSRRVSRWSLRNTYTRETIISGIACNGLTMDEQGFLYVSDFERYDVRRWQVGETHGIVMAGGNGAGNRLDQFNVPRKIFVDRDHSVYVADVHNDRVMKWVKGAKEGIVVAGGRGRGNSLSQLSFPEAIIVDQLGALYIADRYNHRIMRWLKGNTEGHIFVGEGGAGSLPNQLYHPHGLSFDLHGNLYVADGWNNRIQKYHPPLTFFPSYDRYVSSHTSNPSSGFPCGACSSDEDVEDFVGVDVVGFDDCKRSITYVYRCIASSVINIAINCNCTRYVEPYCNRTVERKTLTSSINCGDNC